MFIMSTIPSWISWRSQSETSPQHAFCLSAMFMLVTTFTFGFLNSSHFSSPPAHILRSWYHISGRTGFHRARRNIAYTRQTVVGVMVTNTRGFSNTLRNIPRQNVSEIVSCAQDALTLTANCRNGIGQLNIIDRIYEIWSRFANQDGVSPADPSLFNVTMCGYDSRLRLLLPVRRKMCWPNNDILWKSMCGSDVDK